MFKGGFPTRIDKLIKLLIVAVLVSMMTIELATAQVCVPINGTITDSVSGLPIVGAHVRNQTNVSFPSTWQATDANGFYNLSCYYQNGDTVATTADTKLWVNASGYTEKVLAVNISLVNGSYFGTTPGITAAKMTPITPSVSAGAASSITRTTATITWTVATPTDNVTNNYVGNEVIFQAPGVANITSTWTNSTLAPSRSLSALFSNKRYTAYYITYNLASGSVYGSSTVAFSTLKSNIGATLENEGVTTATEPKGALEILTSVNKTPQQRNIILGIIAVVVMIIAYFYLTVGSGKGKKRK